MHGNKNFVSLVMNYGANFIQNLGFIASTAVDISAIQLPPLNSGVVEMTNQHVCVVSRIPL